MSRSAISRYRGIALFDQLVYDRAAVIDLQQEADFLSRARALVELLSGGGEIDYLATFTGCGLRFSRTQNNTAARGNN